MTQRNSWHAYVPRNQLEEGRGERERQREILVNQIVLYKMFLTFRDLTKSNNALKKVNQLIYCRLESFWWSSPSNHVFFSKFHSFSNSLLVNCPIPFLIPNNHLASLILWFKVLSSMAEFSDRNCRNPLALHWDMLSKDFLVNSNVDLLFQYIWLYDVMF